MDEAAAQLPDFDRLRRLADHDPAGFEAKRREIIEAAITRAPAERQPRLRGLQWQVDQRRRRAPNPLAACIALSGMMWEAVAGQGGLLEALTRPDAPVPGRRRAKVLALRRPEH
jgi:hypothetical protein